MAITAPALSMAYVSSGYVDSRKKSIHREPPSNIQSDAIWIIKPKRACVASACIPAEEVLITNPINSDFWGTENFCYPDEVAEFISERKEGHMQLDMYDLLELFVADHT